MTRKAATPTADRTPTETAQERKLDELIADGAYAKPYVPSEMPGEESAFANPAVQSAIDELGDAVEGEEQARGIVWNEETKRYDARPTGTVVDAFGHALSDMATRADLPPTTVYGTNEELGAGPLEYDVPADGTVQNVRKRQQPPPAKGDEPDLGALTPEHLTEEMITFVNLNGQYLGLKAATTSAKKQVDDQLKVVKELTGQIRDFGGFGAPKQAAAPTLFDRKGPVSDEEYREFMGEARPDDDESDGE